MDWFHRWQMRRAAKRYADRLGPHLRRAYGPAEHYDAGQVRESVAVLRLSYTYIALGYAAFLSEDRYAAVMADAPMAIGYEDARGLVDSCGPSHYSGTWDHHDLGAGMVGGADHFGDGGSA